MVKILPREVFGSNSGSSILRHAKRATTLIMPSCNVQVFRDERSMLTLVGAIFLAYFIVMDVVLYMSLQTTTLIQTTPTLQGHYSPFHPLSVKLLMTDHASHYIINPSTEFFDEVTHFSTIFYFITPNMISFTHVIVAFIAARFVSSESLHDRRIGALLYEFRTFLDGYDGVVYRSHAGKLHIYQSDRASLGYIIDTVCDITGGVFVSFGALFYLFKYFNHGKRQDSLPWTKNGVENGNGTGNGQNGPVYSKKYIFWKCFCYGMLLLFAGASWDHVVDKLKLVYQTKLQDPNLEALQTESLHSFSTWMLMYSWRLCEGQTLIQLLLIVIFIDKIWEFLNFIQYLGYVVITILFVISLIYIKHLEALLHI